MKKKTTPAERAPATKTKPGDLAALFTQVRDLIQSARRGVASAVDTFQVMTNFEIGRRIVEHEQMRVRKRGQAVTCYFSTRRRGRSGMALS